MRTLEAQPVADFPDIDQFVAITQATPADAERFLADGVTLQVSIKRDVDDNGLESSKSPSDLSADGRVPLTTTSPPRPLAALLPPPTRTRKTSLMPHSRLPQQRVVPVLSTEGQLKPFLRNGGTAVLAASPRSPTW